MRKVPRPDITVTPSITRRVVRFEWGFFTLEMYEDEALVMARSIYDALEESDTQPTE